MWVFTVLGERCSWVATSRLVPPCAIRLTTVSSESVRLSQPVFARGWLTRCHCGQPFLPIAVTSHIDGVDGSLNDGIDSHRGEPCIRFGSRLITWSKNIWSGHKCRNRNLYPATVQ